MSRRRYLLAALAKPPQAWWVFLGFTAGWAVAPWWRPALVTGRRHDPMKRLPRCRRSPRPLPRRSSWRRSWPDPRLARGLAPLLALVLVPLLVLVSPAAALAFPTATAAAVAPAAPGQLLAGGRLPPGSQAPLGVSPSPEEPMAAADSGSIAVRIPAAGQGLSMAGSLPPSGTAEPASSDSASGVPLPKLFAQALEASRSGRFGEAMALWNRVLDVAPKDAAAWSNRGNVQLALGDARAAIADQTQSLLLEPANADPHLNRGTAEEALGHWDEAAADYAWILERNPLDASALYNLGNVQGSRGDWQAARDRFVAAADARPGFAMARSSAALAAFQLGDLATAERELRSLIRRYPLFADARAGLTALLWQRGASGEAESHWAAASGLDPRYRQMDWLLDVRRWPPDPVASLERFLRLAT